MTDMPGMPQRPMNVGSLQGAILVSIETLEKKGGEPDRLVLDPISTDQLVREGAWTLTQLGQHAPVLARKQRELQHRGWLVGAMPDLLGLKVVLATECPPYTIMVLNKDADLAKELAEIRQVWEDMPDEPAG